MEVIQVFIISFISVIMTVASYTDLKKREIPDFIPLSLLAFGILILLPTPDRLIISIGAMLMMFSTSSFLFFRQIMGGGDSKLIICLSILFPYYNLNDLIKYPLGFLVLTLLIGLGCMAFMKRETYREIPFAPMIFVAFLVTFFFL